MKIAKVGDLHLFSSLIGGEWEEDSFKKFESRILPKIEEKNPDMIIFLGDIIVPGRGRGYPSWPRGDEASGRFVNATKDNLYWLKNLAEDVFMLRGNHDYTAALKNISEMGGPRYVEDTWIKKDNLGLYFFGSRYPNHQKAAEDLEKIPDPDFSCDLTFLLLHENLGIREEENLPKEIQEVISNRFNVILNGHEHTYRRDKNIFSVGAALPWRPKIDGPWDIKGFWDSEANQPVIGEEKPKFGFYLTDTDKPIDTPGYVSFEPVDLGTKLVSLQVRSKELPAKTLRERAKQFHDILHEKYSEECKQFIVRLYFLGKLKPGDERVDLDLPYLKDIYSDFYEGEREGIIVTDYLEGGGALFRPEELALPTLEKGKQELAKVYGERARKYLEEVEDLLLLKSFERYEDEFIGRTRKSEYLRGE